MALILFKVNLNTIPAFSMKMDFLKIPQVMLVATEIDTGGIPTPAITINARCFQQFIYFSCVFVGIGEDEESTSRV